MDSLYSASAPGKLIISGEHAVVYGAPAIAVAISDRVQARFTPALSGRDVTVNSPVGTATASLDDIAKLRRTLDTAHSEFVAGHRPVGKILASSNDLLFYTLAIGELDTPGTVTVTSDLAIGTGLGSSAACTAAMLRLCTAVSGAPPRLPDELATIVRQCERLQHGHASYIDAATVSYGDVVRVQDATITPLPIDLGAGWYRWNSGAPSSSTGHVVGAVRRTFADTDIWDDFATVTNTLQEAIETGNTAAITAGIRDNHELLTTIGVVPASVATVIGQIVALGGAAKVCGAGSTGGDGAGQVLVYLPNTSPDVVAGELGLTLKAVQRSHTGTRVGSVPSHDPA